MIMQHRIPNFELLATFLAVHSDGNFSVSAQRLNITQSAVSHRIKRLEEELGIVLFDRSPHHVFVTEAGAKLASEIEPAFKTLETAFSSFNPQGECSLEIEVEPAFSTKWLAPRLKKFLNENPSLKLQLNLSDKRLEFSGQTQIAIKWGHPESWPEYQCEPLMGLTFTPMCSPEFAQKNKLFSPIDILRCVLIHDRDYDNWLAWARLNNLPLEHFKSGHIIRDTPLLEQTAIESDGVALYAIELADAALRRGDLTAPFPKAKLMSNAHYMLLKHPTRRLSDAGKSFDKWIRHIAHGSD
ncbi:LysR family transcriptional regulator [Brucella sp. NBRC 12950]|uniref:LysR family transcriptional regulator n=1 Tax=Brucella sp. NBRC 12950 TaxID=2994518 RepID=UPI0024A0CF81|nr:LysR family transcriptional regulator [Brucella sp. NBRC 12950]GLU30111.1 DNA-binding transcriptional regulator DsdC [Brucella sp. NBRC 12950]